MEIRERIDAAEVVAELVKVARHTKGKGYILWGALELVFILEKRGVLSREEGQALEQELHRHAFPKGGG